jgi:DNA ligase 1
MKYEDMFMRASVYDKQYVNAYLTPKYNGLRAAYFPNVGFVSRDGKIWNPDVLQHIDTTGIKHILDGELYCHNMPLQDIMSAVAVTRDKPTAESKLIFFYPFDIIDFTKPAKARMKLLHDLMPVKYRAGFIYYKPRLVDSAEDIKDFMDAKVSSGYEGICLRQADSFYIPQGPNKTASIALTKLKNFQDAVFACVAVKIATQGQFKGLLGALVCRAANGKLFKVGTGFTAQQREQFAKALPSNSVSVNYLNLSNTGIPLNTSFNCFV